MKKFRTKLGEYSLLDTLLLTGGGLTMLILGIVFGSEWYLVVSTVLMIIVVFTQAKGQILTQILGCLMTVFYSVNSFFNGLYGEVILYLILLLPMNIYGTINWLKHKEKDEAVVLVERNLSKKEWMLMFIGIVFTGIGSYFLLKILNTAELLISTFSFVSMLPAMYLLVRRCKWNQIAFFINDCAIFALWFVMMVNTEISLLPIVVSILVQMVYDIYGFICWVKLENKQSGDLKLNEKS